MFRNRQAEELRAQLAEVQQELHDIAPYADIAKEIKQKVGLLATGGVDLDTAFTEAIHDTSIEVRQKTVQTLFKKLPPTEQWAKLHQIYGDEEIGEALESQRQRELGRLRRDGGVLALAEQVQAEGRLRMNSLEEGQMIEIGLYRPTDLNRTTKPNRNGADLVRLLTGTITPTKEIHVLSDGVEGHSIARDEYFARKMLVEHVVADHTVVKVGSFVRETSQSYFTPVLYRDATAAQKIGNKAIPLELDVGTVGVNGISLFGN